MLNPDALNHQGRKRTVYADGFGRLSQSGHTYRFDYSRAPVLSNDIDAHNFGSDAEAIRQFRLCSALASGRTVSEAKHYADAPIPTRHHLRREAVGNALRMIRAGTDQDQIIWELGNTDRYMPLLTGMTEDEQHRYLCGIIRLAEHQFGIR
jgi:hypothetical protein